MTDKTITQDNKGKNLDNELGFEGSDSLEEKQRKFEQTALRIGLREKINRDRHIEKITIPLKVIGLGLIVLVLIVVITAIVKWAFQAVF